MEEQTGYIDHLSKKQYDEAFDESVAKKTKRTLALERAWQNRDFEIDKYWSRATYFWAFIAASFAGYIAVMTSDKIKPPFQTELAFVVICMGLVFSCAWLLVNLGSKKWQENWEKHIDMLEDDITGPLYKTVLNHTAFSVSWVNIAVSGFVSVIWFLLGFAQAIGVPYVSQNHALLYGGFDWPMFVTGTVTVAFLAFLFVTSIRYARPKEKNKSKAPKFSFHRRPIEFFGPEQA